MGPDRLSEQHGRDAMRPICGGSGPAQQTLTLIKEINADFYRILLGFV